MSGLGASVAGRRHCRLTIRSAGWPCSSGRRCPCSPNPPITPARAGRERAHAPKGGVGPLALGALGVVYGDIGTSPLYAMDQIFRVAPARTAEDALGAVSLVIWTLTVIVAIKYALLVLRAQNDGEGGVFALYGLLHDRKDRRARLLLWALMVGAGLLIGDGMITPAISVLSAVEGVGVAAPGLSSAVVPITLGLLIALFAVQFKGASGVGSVFGPIVLVWFIAIAALGAAAIAEAPQILAAFNPAYGFLYLGRVDFVGALMLLGALMLVVTGGEAMYADLGHFGALPIRLSWYAIVYPALLLNYLGQGAHLIGANEVAGDKLFFALSPSWLLMPMVVLATFATVIASQSLISGAFSLVSQAIRLGLFPRLDIEHTHHAHEGQVYIPAVNWALLVGCVTLVLVFGSSSALAAAYGLAVSGVMVITSVAMIPIALRYWGWSSTLTALVWGPLTALNAAFFAASSLKLLEGGYVPIAVGAAAFAMMATWRWGRKATYAAHNAKATLTMSEIVDAAPGEQRLSRTQRAHHVAPTLTRARRPRPLARPPDRRADRHAAAQLDFRRGQPQEDPLHPRQPLSGDRVRPQSRKGQRDRRRVVFRLPRGSQRRAGAGGPRPAQRDRPAGRPAPVDRACDAGPPAAVTPQRPVSSGCG